MKSLSRGRLGGTQRVGLAKIARVGVGLLLVLLAGCSQDHYKQDADQEVYGIIEGKWQDDFGTLANYKIRESTPNEVEIKALVPKSKVLSLADAVGIATQLSRSYQGQKESLYLSALSLTGTRHDYAWQWLGTVDATYSANNGSDDVSLSSGVEGNQTLLFDNGVQVSAGLAVDWLRYLTGDPDTSLSSVLTGTVTAPILGAGAGKAAVENLTQAERGMLYDVRSFNRYRQTFVCDIISDYYNVLQLKDTVTITETSYRSKVDSVDQLRMEVEVGQGAQADAAEAEQSLLSARSSLISVQQRYAQALDTFKISLALPIELDIVLDQNELAGLGAQGVSQLDYSEADALATALQRRLDLANTRDELIDAERKLVLAAEGLGPQIDLTVSANVDSTPDTKVTRLRFHEGEYSLGLAADLPFDRKAERNSYREALISVQQAQRNYDEAVDEVKLDVRQAYRDLAETSENYEIQHLGVKLAKSRVNEQKIRLKYGSSTVRQLIESEDDLLAARSSLTDALVSHAITKLNFFRDIGVLQVRPDGMWEQATP